jgi:hypothetical protein
LRIWDLKFSYRWLNILVFAMWCSLVLYKCRASTFRIEEGWRMSLRNVGKYYQTAFQEAKYLVVAMNPFLRSDIIWEVLYSPAPLVPHNHQPYHRVVCIVSSNGSNSASFSRCARLESQPGEALPSLRFVLGFSVFPAKCREGTSKYITASLWDTRLLWPWLWRLIFRDVTQCSKSAWL